MNFIKQKLLLLFLLVFLISPSNANNSLKLIALEEKVSKDFYKVNQNLIYAKNFEEYKKNISIIINSITKKNRQ